MLKNIKSWVLVASGIFALAISSCTGPKPSEKYSAIDFKVDSVLKTMSLEEKIGQMIQVSSYYSSNPMAMREAVKSGSIGSILNETDLNVINELQHIAREQSPHGIPLIVGRDVIHGYKTVFPIPLGQAASWDTALVEQAAHVAAIESRSTGINWTFSPMVDVSRDPRWGRVAEGYGEDTYLSSVMGVATVKGYQGSNMAGTDRIAACVKHFAAYGAVEAGRDYNSVSMSDQDLRNVYLPSYEASIKAGAATVMTSFNEINGIPSSGNKTLLTDVLRNEWGFKGFVVSDWASIAEMVNHGFASDNEQCAQLAANAGLDMEMATDAYSINLPKLIKENKVSLATIDQEVRNILRIKFELGLFDHPYVDEYQKLAISEEEGLEIAKKLATESVVLLQNNNQLLPLSKSKKIAVVGPMANDRYEQLGTWTFDGDTNRSITPLIALRQKLGEKNVVYIPSLTYSRDKRTNTFAKVKAQASQCDVIVAFVGEEAILSGEAHCRANIDLPGAQAELINLLAETGKPVVTVVMSGRPNSIGNILNQSSALLYAWHPGNMAGPAIADLLFGDAVPSGKLPISIPKSGGQCPIYYAKKNTGRPSNIYTWTPIDKIPVRAVQTSLGNNSHHLDDGFDPLFPFGYGLTYSSIEYSDLTLSSKKISVDGKLTASIKITNTGNYEAYEVAQLYVRDLVGSITRPVKELKKFERIQLDPGQSKVVTFTLTADDLAFYKSWDERVIEPGEFNLWIGTDSASGPMEIFEVE